MTIEVDTTARDSNTNIIQRIARFKAALNELMVQPEIQGPINQGSEGVARKLNVDEAEVADFVSHKLPCYLATINITDPEWPELLRRWCRSVAGKYGLNILRRREPEKKYEDLETHLNSNGKRNSKPVFKPDIPTPEDELSQKEQETIWEARSEDIHARTCSLIATDDVANLWSQDYTPKQIAALLKKSPKTIYGRLKKKQKEVMKAIGLKESAENKAIIKKGLRELYANSLGHTDHDTPDREDTLLNITVSTEQCFVSEPNGGVSKKSDVSVILHKRPRKKAPPKLSH
jgi:hypothetical protein